MSEIERVWDREKKIGYRLHKGTKTLVRGRERFEIEGVQDRESQLYKNIFSISSTYGRAQFLCPQNLSTAFPKLNLFIANQIKGMQ